MGDTSTRMIDELCFYHAADQTRFVTNTSWEARYLGSLDENLGAVLLPGEHQNWTMESVVKAQNPAYQRAEEILYSRVVVALGAFGVLGNVLNLFVLTRKSLLNSLSRMEKFAYSGLIALAIADLCFCVTVLPMAVVDVHQHIFTHKSFSLYYAVYNNAVINVAIMSSTWLTVTLAAGRYFAICFPLRARQITGLTSAKRSIALLLVICTLFNLPRFWYDRIEGAHCPSGVTIYFREQHLRHKLTFYLVYTWIYFILAILLPLVALSFCNIYLIRALSRSSSGRSSMRQSGSPGGAQSQSIDFHHCITLTLVILVLMYTFFVCPSEITSFARETVLRNVHFTDAYNLAVAIANTLQAVNFSFNFAIYSAINAHFRRTMRDFFCRRTSGGASGQNDTITLHTVGLLSRNASSTRSAGHPGQARNGRATDSNAYRSCVTYANCRAEEDATDLL